jgi:hypothetical protein
MFQDWPDTLLVERPFLGFVIKRPDNETGVVAPGPASPVRLVVPIGVEVNLVLAWGKAEHSVRIDPHLGDRFRQHVFGESSKALPGVETAASLYTMKLADSYGSPSWGHWFLKYHEPSSTICAGAAASGGEEESLQAEAKPTTRPPTNTSITSLFICADPIHGRVTDVTLHRGVVLGPIGSANRRIAAGLHPTSSVGCGQQVAHIRLGGMMWLVWHAPVGRWNTG